MSGAIIFLKKQFNLTPPQVGFAMTSAILACFVSPSIGGWLADRIGRKRTLIAAAGVFALSAIGTGLSHQHHGIQCIQDPGWLWSGRRVHRLAHVHRGDRPGIYTRAIGVHYASFECRRRTDLVRRHVYAFVFRKLAMDVRFDGDSRDRVSGRIGVRSGKPAMARVKGRIDEALKGLRRISSEKDAQAELRAIRETSSPVKARVGDLFKPGIRIALLIAVGLAVLQQFDGVTVLLFYAPTIMQEAGFPQASKAIFISLLIGGWNLICTIVAYWLVDWAGRRPLLLYGFDRHGGWSDHYGNIFPVPRDGHCGAADDDARRRCIFHDVSPGDVAHHG